jgi:flagellar protein FlbD
MNGVIELTSFSLQKIWVNQDLLKLIETTPDTVLCFLDGSRMLVKESPQEINEKVIQYFKTIQAASIKD